MQAKVNLFNSYQIILVFSFSLKIASPLLSSEYSFNIVRNSSDDPDEGGVSELLLKKKEGDSMLKLREDILDRRAR